MEGRPPVPCYSKSVLDKREFSTATGTDSAVTGLSPLPALSEPSPAPVPSQQQWTGTPPQLLCSQGPPQHLPGCFTQPARSSWQVMRKMEHFENLPHGFFKQKWAFNLRKQNWLPPAPMKNKGCLDTWGGGQRWNKGNERSASCLRQRTRQELGGHSQHFLLPGNNNLDFVSRRLKVNQSSS